MRRFAGHLQALIESLGGEGTLAAGEESGSPRAARRRLSDWDASRLAQFDRAVPLYFDEFQALNNRAALSVFRALLAQLPDNLTEERRVGKEGVRTMRYGVLAYH